MPEGPDGRTIIIVKKVVGHGGHHGGSWKVAYADFVTSMMCLFLVLWLVNSASVVTREKIASYFKRPGIFESGSGAPLQIGGAGFLPLPESDPTEETRDPEAAYDITKRKKDGGDTPNIKKGYNEKISKRLQAAAKELEEHFKTGGIGNQNGDKNPLESKQDGTKIIGLDSGIGIAGLEKDREEEELQYTEEPRIEIYMDDYGLNLEIMDTSQGSMFPSGSSKFSPIAERKIIEIGQILAKLPNKLDIEGHTDSLPFNDSNAQTYDNWDLSADRANAARRGLTEGGIEKSRIIRVAGFADTKPRVPSKPDDPSNRRISIKVRYTPDAEAAIRDNLLTDYSVGTMPRPNSEDFTKTEDEPQIEKKSDGSKNIQNSGPRVELSPSQKEPTQGNQDTKRSESRIRSQEKYLIFDTKRNIFDQY